MWILSRWLATALVALLVACGGGSEEDERKGIKPPDCRTEPARCA